MNQYDFSFMFKRKYYLRMAFIVSWFERFFHRWHTQQRWNFGLLISPPQKKEAKTRKEFFTRKKYENAKMKKKMKQAFVW